MSLSQYVIETVGLDATHESPLMFGGNRWNFLPDLFNWAGFSVGAEVGVGSGRFSRRLCETVSDLRLYAIDPWECYDYYKGRQTQANLDRSYRKAWEQLAPLDCEIIKDYSEQVVAGFRDASLDFVYIDANRTFESVTRNLALWTEKVRIGGVVSGCCYYNERDHAIGQVQDAVDAWTLDNAIDPWFVAIHHRYPVYFWERR